MSIFQSTDAIAEAGIAPLDACVHELFERQVARTPDAVAVVCGERQLSYRQLNERANRVAHRLRRRGVGVEALVGVCLERSPEMIAALLGIWKSGAAYVPLDPSYPPERLAFMVRDAGLRLLLTDQESVQWLGHAVEAIRMDGDWLTLGDEEAANPAAVATPADLAYVMYTSGSTGQPKGAMILHSGLTNYVHWAIDAYGFRPAGQVPLHSSIAFDLTVTSLYPPLLVGGGIDLLPESSGMQSLVAAVRRGSRYDVLKITPAHLELLSRQLRPAEMAAVSQAIVIGGENLAAESLRPWRCHAPATRLFNEYGPTETVVGCCVHEVQDGDPDNGSIPIGRPIANTRLHVLDADQHPVPAGVTGELYIGGAGVARGYFNRAQVTAERFLPDPFDGAPGACLYRTGDLVRARADGILEYLGREDSQVKIRGYRIELGEIEANLLVHANVRAAAVLAREDAEGERQLAAYVVPDPRGLLTAGELQDFLKQRLPDYMIPRQCVLLDALPLTENGKIDRSALPHISYRDVAVADRFAAPRTEAERKLAAIWSKLLDLEQIGIHDDVFDLGAHSLMAIRAVSRIRAEFEAELQIQTIFANPTVAALAKVLMASSTVREDIPRIGPRRETGPCALSFAQEQLWFLHRLAPESPVYHVVDVIRFDGRYDAVALRKAVEELVRRHEILRTVFEDGPGQPVQIVLPAADVDLRELDLRSWPEAEREEAWRLAARQEVRQAFVLSRPPLRWLLVHLSDREHRLLLTIHHIIADEWSMDLCQQELHRLYEAFAQGREFSRIDLPIQYAAFASWQRDPLREAAMARQLGYWREELAGASTVLDLPIDRPRPVSQSFRGATEYFEVDRSLTERLKTLAREEAATMFMVLEAAFVALLHRYTGQNDILVGTPITGRTQAETETMVGCFLNTVVLRGRFDDQPTFRDLLQQTRQRALAAYAHAEVPFNRLVADLAPSRDAVRSPLFQAMFILHDADNNSQVARMSQQRHLRTGTSKFELTMELSENDGHLEALMEYSTDLFEEATVRRMCGHYVALLAAVADDAERRVSQLPLLSDGEWRALRENWTPPIAAHPARDRSLHRLIEAQCAATPERTAIVFGQQSLSYGEMNRRANQLARCLRDHGVGPDVLVGIYLERSLDMVVGLLAVLKSGGAYVPLDPGYPRQRLAGIMEDAGAAVVLTEERFTDDLPWRVSGLISMDGMREDIAGYDDGNLPGADSPDDLAYVIFTSGSTGRPKGVAVTRGSLVNLLDSMGCSPGLSSSDVLLAITTLSFDIAALELYLPLIKGALLVLASRDEAIEGRRLMARMSSCGVTLMQATPATWRMLIDAGWEGTAGLRILCGGEALSRDLADQLLQRAAEVWNVYGPTETTIWSSAGRVEPGEGPIPIGRPIANTHLWVLDANLEPVPAGVIGELCIGGAGVALGYWRRPDLTAEKFVRDRLSGMAGARLYRTGDRARWLPDGRLECLGRMDHQLKIRGFRIEPGEIEAAIAQHPEVGASVVTAREDAAGEKRLVAYIVAENPPTDLVDQLRLAVRAAVPEYMVPSHFVLLDALPLTPNGKVDRQALPAPGDTAAKSPPTPCHPRTTTEEAIFGMFRQVLGREDFGIFDSFFDLGGHSLMAARLISGLQDATSPDVLLRHLFERPTVAGLAEVVDRLSLLAGRHAKSDYSEREEIAL